MRNESVRAFVVRSVLPLALAALASLQPYARGQQGTPHILPLQYGTPVTGAPFSAVRTLDYEPAANSSDPVAVHAEEKISRDSAGRTRSEITYPNRQPTVDILDFVEHVHYHWTVGDTVVTRSVIKEPTVVARKSFLGKLGDDSPQVEGVPTHHTREVRGAASETSEVVESWYSPDLHLAMVTISDRPGLGKSTFRFQHLSRTEPDAALFRCPPGFTIDDPRQAPPPPSVALNESAKSSVPFAMGSNGSSTHADQPEYMADPKFQKALAQAKNRALPVVGQIENWKHANKLAHAQCVECLHQLTTLQMSAAAWKDAVNSTLQLEALSTQPKDKLFAEAERGFALMHYNDGAPKPEQLMQADAAFRDVLAKLPHASDVMFQEGRVLALQSKNDEAKAMFERYVELVPASDRLRMRAERFASDPHLATLAMAPPFRMVTSDGEELQLDNMNGKVVLLDFWATWCGPCKESLPEIARIVKDYANDPMLVVISVSQDADAVAWKAFVQKNNMTWPQYRDVNNALGQAYGVNGIPHFFTIDTNGALKTEQIGSNADVHIVVSDLVKKAHKAAAQQAKMIAANSGD